MKKFTTEYTEYTEYKILKLTTEAHGYTRIKKQATIASLFTARSMSFIRVHQCASVAHILLGDVCVLHSESGGN